MPSQIDPICGLQQRFQEEGLNDIKVVPSAEGSTPSTIQILGSLVIVDKEWPADKGPPAEVNRLDRIRKDFMKKFPDMQVIGGEVIGFNNGSWEVGRLPRPPK